MSSYLKDFEEVGYPAWIDSTDYTTEDHGRLTLDSWNRIIPKKCNEENKTKDKVEIVTDAINQQLNKGNGFIFWIVLGLAFCIAAGYSLSKCSM